MTKVFFTRVPSGRQESWGADDLIKSWCHKNTEHDYYETKAQKIEADLKALQAFVAMLLPLVQANADSEQFKDFVEKLIPYSIQPGSLDIRL